MAKMTPADLSAASWEYWGDLLSHFRMHAGQRGQLRLECNRCHRLYAVLAEPADRRQHLLMRSHLVDAHGVKLAPASGVHQSGKKRRGVQSSSARQMPLPREVEPPF